MPSYTMSSVPRCDFNMYNIRYAAVLAKQRGIKRAMESEEDEGEESEAASDPANEMLVA